MMAIAEKSLIEGEAAGITLRSRTSWRSFVSLAGRTSKSKKLSGMASGFVSSFFSDECRIKGRRCPGPYI